MRSLFIALLLTLTIPGAAFAGTVYLDGHNITLGETDVVEGDFYVSSGLFSQTEVTGTVAGDVYAWGGFTKLLGSVAGDVGTLALATTINGTVADDVRVLAGDVVVEGLIDGDLFVTAQHLEITETAKISGNVYFFGLQAQIDGSVAGNVYGTYGAVVLQGSIAGSVDLTSLTAPVVAPTAQINGDLTYASNQTIARSPSSIIEGSVTHTVTADTASDKRGYAVSLLILLFSALTVYLLLHKHLSAFTAVAMRSYVQASVVGVGVLLLAPSVVVLLLVSKLAFLIGVLLLLLLLLGIVCAIPLTAVLVGALLAKLVQGDTRVNVWWVVAGVFVLCALAAVPILGAFSLLCFYTLTLGALIVGVCRLL